MSKRIIALFSIGACLLSMAAVGCSGDNPEDTKKEMDAVNKNLEGMPPAGPDPMGAPIRKGAGGPK